MTSIVDDGAVIVVKSSQRWSGLSWMFDSPGRVNERSKHDEGILVGPVVHSHGLGKSRKLPKAQLRP